MTHPKLLPLLALLLAALTVAGCGDPCDATEPFASCGYDGVPTGWDVDVCTENQECQVACAESRYEEYGCDGLSGAGSLCYAECN